ncbi:MAG: hypothetical protein HYR73_09160 [Candidatus Eisenbacteria bacterium]|nr:hypothetical protein [Candidatus Eisenbacteria bacterium]
MIRTRWFRSALAVAVIAAAAAGVDGCSKKLTVDPAYTMPEGVYSPDARLVVYPDQGNLVEAKHPAPTPTDPYYYATDSSFTVYAAGPGVTLGTIVDGTAASSYQLLRRESGGGFAVLKDFSLIPVVKWLDSHWAAYTFQDASTPGFSPPTYMARGIVSGTVTATSPLSNAGLVSSGPIGHVVYTGPGEPPDSLFTISWRAVPGAVGYWLQVFTFRGDLRTGSEKFPLGIPAPLVIGKVHDHFVGYVAAPKTSYKIGGPGAEIMTYKPMIMGPVYRVRVAAVDGNGSLLAVTPGPDTVLAGTEALIYSLGAAAVHPKRPPPSIPVTSIQ